MTFGVPSSYSAAPVAADTARNTSSPQRGGAPTPPSYMSFYGAQQAVQGEFGGWRIRLAEWQPLEWPPRRFKFLARNGKAGGTLQFTLGAWDGNSKSLQANQVVEIDPLNDSRALILGLAAAGASVADIVDLPSGVVVDRFNCFDPIISPNHHFLAYVKSFPGHPGPDSVSDEYLAYDLTRTAGYNRPHFQPNLTYDAGWPVYPPGSTNAAGENLVPGLDAPAHRHSSTGFFWLDDQRLAFTDFFDGQNRLVVANLSNGIQKPDIKTLRLDASGIVDLEKCRGVVAPSDFARWSKDPGGLIRVSGITPVPGQSGTVQLGLVPGPCLTQSELTVTIPQ